MKSRSIFISCPSLHHPDCMWILSACYVQGRARLLDYQHWENEPDDRRLPDADAGVQRKTNEFQGELLMEELWPFLLITGPDGEQFRAEIRTDRVTIGRSDLYNDIALEPDPQKLISRKIHCLLERTPDGWWVAHNGGINPTYVVRRGEA